MGCRQQQDLVVAGSASVAHALIRHDVVDELRLLVFPAVLGEGQRLFEASGLEDPFTAEYQPGEQSPASAFGPHHHRTLVPG